MDDKEDTNNKYYDSEDEDEEVFDTDLIDVEMEDDFKSQGKERCKDAFLNISGEDDIDSEAEDEAPTRLNKQEFGSDGEIDDTDAKVADLGAGEYPIHNPSVKWNKMKPILGERYESAHQLKTCVTNYAIHNGYSIGFLKCDSVRLVARCGTKNDTVDCPYRLYASWMSKERSFQVKRLRDEHKCVKRFKTANLMTPNWLARHFLKRLMMNPNLKCNEIQHIIKTKFHCEVCWSKCYRARCRAMSLIDGKLTEHYARVWDYRKELLRSNPGSTIIVNVTKSEVGTYFDRMYVCFKAIKEGWKKGCRRVIGIDGSFLKGPCKGELLTAIGRDANNHVYPIAWAVVDIENKVNWRWFLGLVQQDLGLEHGRDLIVISDQHKGLLEATKEILPYVEHRQCARHIYANFRKTFSGLEFKSKFWSTAFSTVEGEYLKKMEDIKQINPSAYDHLLSRQPQSWCRAFFGTGIPCEAVENGIAECFNSIIRDARKKPLLAMLEEIRLYMMDRFYKMLQKAEKFNSQMCPAAIKKMHKFGEDLRNWYVNPSGPSVFEARNGYEGYSVDLEGRVCSCRLWQISGIPCVHAQASIYFTGQDPALFINEWFSVERFKSTYACNILPVNGTNLWPTSSQTKPLPPIARRMPGRPSIKRKRHISESQDKYSVSGKGRTITCKNCLQKGHNKLSCKNPTVTPKPKPKKKMGRPRVESDASHWSRGGGRSGGRSGGRGRSGRGGGRSGRGAGRSGGRGNVTEEGCETAQGVEPINVCETGEGSGTINEFEIRQADETLKETGEGSGPVTEKAEGSGPVTEKDRVEPIIVCETEKGEGSGTLKESGEGSGTVKEACEGSGNELLQETDLIQVWQTVDDLLQSKYTEKEVMDCLGLTNEQMIQILEFKETVIQQMSVEFDDLLEVVVEEEVGPQQETEEVEVEIEGGPAYTQDDEDSEVETHVQTQEEGIPETQVQAIKPTIRKPSERITKSKLKKIVTAVGTAAEDPLDLD